MFKKDAMKLGWTISNSVSWVRQKGHFQSASWGLLVVGNHSSRRRHFRTLGLWFVVIAMNATDSKRLPHPQILQIRGSAKAADAWGLAKWKLWLCLSRWSITEVTLANWLKKAGTCELDEIIAERGFWQRRTFDFQLRLQAFYRHVAQEVYALKSGYDL